MSGEVVALVGAQYGSEGKGLVAAAYANKFDVHVRTGGPNAGHTYYHNGTKYVARSIPCGWINPNAHLYIGPGAVVDLEVFAEELNVIQKVDPDIGSRITIDPRAVVISHAQRMAEGGVHGQAHKQIGSTGEGVGLARMSRINRDTLIVPSSAPFHCDRICNHHAYLSEELKVNIGDVSEELYNKITRGAKVLLEGTQGYGLSLTLGDWPYCTSADTNAAQLASDAGISPSFVKRTILVARTYPIRVWGNSGPLYGETTWEELGLQPEYTTVTKKVRRVGRWNSKLVAAAARVNSPAELFITFLDYMFPETAGATTELDISTRAMDWIYDVAVEVKASVIGVGTGPQTYHILEPPVWY